MSTLDFPPDELERQFNPRVATPNYQPKVDARAADSERARARLEHVTDVRYGPGALETLDIFPAAEPNAPVQLFIHGGYWRAMDKSGYSYVAVPFVARGATVVVINYDLAPAVTLDEIVAEARRAIAWTFRNIARHGGDPERLYISGNSAGGHLVAMALAYDWTQDDLPPDLIKGATAITGVFDCEPVLGISVNDEVRLDEQMARRNSPIHFPPRRPLPLLVAVGGAEPAGWIAMSKDYVRACRDRGIACDYLELPGMDHFDISGAMGDPESALTRAMLAQMRLA